MGNLSNEKSEDIALQSLDEFQKLALSFIPAGPILDTVLNFRNRLKQKRVIDFSESLKNILEETAGRELHASDFANEDFIDIMESVYQKVQSTKSEFKLKRFRNILFNQIVDPVDLDTSLTYVRILDELNDVEIAILHKVYLRGTEDLPSNGFFENIFKSERNNKNEHSLSINGQTLIVPYYILLFHLDHLISLGLLERRTETYTPNMPILSSTWGSGEKKTDVNKPIQKEYIDMTGVGSDFIYFVSNPEE